MATNFLWMIYLHCEVFRTQTKLGSFANEEGLVRLTKRGLESV